jgi:hypothetical protein
MNVIKEERERLKKKVIDLDIELEDPSFDRLMEYLQSIGEPLP